MQCKYYFCPICGSNVSTFGLFLNYSGSCLKCLGLDELEGIDSIESDPSIILKIFLEKHLDIENPIKKGWNEGKWYPYSPILGDISSLSYIGYCHKIVDGENFSDGLTDSEAIKLHEKDFFQSYAYAETIYEQDIGESFNDCTLGAKLIAGELVFNLGKSEFENYKEFRKGMKENDIEKMVIESKAFEMIGGVKYADEKTNWFRKKTIEILNFQANII